MLQEFRRTMHRSRTRQLICSDARDRGLQLVDLSSFNVLAPFIDF